MLGLGIGGSLVLSMVLAPEKGVCLQRCGQLSVLCVRFCFAANFAELETGLSEAIIMGFACCTSVETEALTSQARATRTKILRVFLLRRGPRRDA